MVIVVVIPDRMSVVVAEVVSKAKETAVSMLVVVVVVNPAVAKVAAVVVVVDLFLRMEGHGCSLQISQYECTCGARDGCRTVIEDFFFVVVTILQMEVRHLS